MERTGTCGAGQIRTVSLPGDATHFTACPGVPANIHHRSRLPPLFCGAAAVIMDFSY